MKRKRGHKKGNQKKPPLKNVNGDSTDIPSSNLEHDSCLDDAVHAGVEPKINDEAPSPELSDRTDKYASATPDGVIEKPAVKATYGRVKVKLKTSKALEPHPTSSEAPTQSDTDKSSLQVGSGTQDLVAEKMEDSANSSSDSKGTVSGDPSKKSGSIKDTSKGFSSSTMDQNTGVGLVQSEHTHLKGKTLPHHQPFYSKAELDASLEVIKKIMRMDAAEPFNAPVNPVELGIPDYFDVIDTPMDFGTICSNLESGTKYMNSLDVYKDVQYIWENCNKYNNKGDYILELMKRVKKNFSKYWTASGLSDDQSKNFSGVQSIQEENSTYPAQGKQYIKGKHKAQKRHGFKRHKDSCLCAICIMRRRKIEREKNARIAEDQMACVDGAQEFKQEGFCVEGSPGNEDISSNMGNSLDPDTDLDMDEKGEVAKINIDNQQFSSQQEEEKECQMVLKCDPGTVEQSHQADRAGKESMPESEEKIFDDFGGASESNTEKERPPETEEGELILQKKNKEALDEQKKGTAFEELLRYENPVLVQMCGTLFPNNAKSVWGGPHSLVRHQGPSRTSSIHAAIATLME